MARCATCMLLSPEDESPIDKTLVDKQVPRQQDALASNVARWAIKLNFNNMYRVFCRL